MNATLNQELSNYQRFILNKIIISFDAGNNLNIYELVKIAVSSNRILPSQNALIMETYYTLKEYLLANNMAIEKEEMTAYLLTEKGKQLITCRTIEEFENRELKKERKTIIQKLSTPIQRFFLHSASKAYN